jgi:16S rRNA G966 N2-methylase RsmD
MSKNVEIIGLRDLKPDPQNARKHTPRNVAMVVDALQEVGAARSIVIDEKGVVLAGNATIKAAGKAGLARVRVVDSDGDEIVAVRRTNLTERQKKRLALYDNRAAELAEWDSDVLSKLLKDDADTLAGLWREDELKTLLESDDFAEDETEGKPSFGVFARDQIAGEAFRYFRANGFPYPRQPLHQGMAEINRLNALVNANFPTKSRLGLTIANSYHPHRYKAAALGKRSPVEAFADDKILKRAIALELDGGGVGDSLSVLAVTSWTQGVSNFRPSYAAYIYKKYCHKSPGKVLDICTGYGGRLVGAIASGTVGMYVGIDACKETVEANRRLAADLGFSDRTLLIHAACEDVKPSQIGDDFDLCFTSPPYFCKEIYSEESTQSCNRYTTPESWRDEFLLPAMKLQASVLKPGGFTIINIADVTIDNEIVPLERWTVECGKAAGLMYKGQEHPYELNYRFGLQGDSVASEPVFVFRKP